MKKTFKRAISVFLMVAVLTTMILVTVPLSASAVVPDTSDPMGIKIIRDYSGYAVNTNAVTTAPQLIGLGDPGETAVIRPTVGGLGAVNSVKLGAASEMYSLSAYYDIQYPNYPRLDGLDGIMIYVKLPRGQWQKSTFFFNVVIAPGDGSPYISPHWGDWSAGNKHVSYLSSTSSKWEDGQTDSEGNMSLPYGFEGYVKFLFSDLSGNIGNWGGGTVDIQKVLSMPDTAVAASAVKFGQMGGVYGSCHVGAVYGITNDSDSIAAVLSGESAVKGLNTGNIVNPKDEITADKAMKGFVMQDFNAYDEEEAVADGDQGIFKSDSKPTGFSATAVAKTGGFDNTPALKLDATTGTLGFGPAYMVKSPINTRTDGIEAMMFYIKCPAPYPGEDVSKLKVVLYSYEPNAGNDPISGTEKWSNLDEGGKAEYMPEGGNEWTEVTADSQIIQLPAGFEGYIKIDILQLIANQPESWNGRVVGETMFWFSAIGDTYGPAVIHSVYGITDKGSDDKLFTLNGIDVYDLTTDEPAPSYNDASLEAVKAYLLNNGELTPTQARLFAFDGKANNEIDIIDLLMFKEYLTTPSGSVGINIANMSASTSEYDIAMLNNPDRGFRLETMCNVANTTTDGMDAQPDPTAPLYSGLAYYADENPQLAQAYFYMTGYKNTSTIPQYGLDRIQSFF